MATYRATIDTDADAATAFAFLEDFTNAASWDPGVASATRRDDGPIGVGSRFDLDLAVGRSIQRWVYEVTEHAAPERVVFTTRSRLAEGIDAVTVRSTPTGCTVEWDATFRFVGPLGRLADPLFQLVFRRIAEKAVAGLRPALEALPAAA